MQSTFALDTRQRAMLEAMGVPVWLPAAPSAAAADVVTPGPTAAIPGTIPVATTKAVTVPVVTVPAARAADPVIAAAPDRAAAPSARAANLPTAGRRTLAEPRLLFGNADPAAVPAGLGAGWLIVAEPAPVPIGATAALDGSGADPLAGDAGRLLSNMLRAMRLDQHPRVFFAPLLAADGDADGDGQVDSGAGKTASLQQRLDAVIAATRPALVLVMGRVAAQALLQSAEPLGRLRGRVLQLPGVAAEVPALVTYDAPYLLRAPADKARAWADLCLALHTVRLATAAPVPPA